MLVQEFPKLYELYEVIINDCYKIFSLQQKEKDKNSVEGPIDLINKIETLKLNIKDNKYNNQKYPDIISFSLKYINNIFTFFLNKEENNIDVEYIDDYCLAYIALVGFRYNLIKKIEEDELFLFELKNYENYSNFLTKYNIKDQVIQYYKELSNPLKNSINIEIITLIKVFDAEKKFFPQLTGEKNEMNEQNYNKRDYSESFNGVI